MNKLFKINDKDTVAVALCDLKAGYSENGITLKSDVPFGHKVLIKDTPAGQDIIKYGYPIGLAKKIFLQAIMFILIILKQASETVRRHIFIMEISTGISPKKPTSLSKDIREMTVQSE